jgi:hypothetical protein
MWISLEMSWNVTVRRVTANLFRHSLKTLTKLSLPDIQTKLDQCHQLKQLRVRKYDGGTARAGHFDQYLKKLARTDKFVPDVLIVDYLNECTSKTLSRGKNTNSYDYVGACVAELKQLASRHNVVLWTATQTNRAGHDGTPDMKNTSDSAKTNEKVDVMVGICPDPHQFDLLVTNVIKLPDGEKPGKPFMTRVDLLTMTLFDYDDPVATDRADMQSVKEVNAALKIVSQRSTSPRYRRKS